MPSFENSIKELKIHDILDADDKNKLFFKSKPTGKKLVYFGYILGGHPETIECEWPTQKDLTVISPAQRKNSGQEHPDMVIFEIKRADGGTLPLVFNNDGKQSLAKYDTIHTVKEARLNYFGLVPETSSKSGGRKSATYHRRSVSKKSRRRRRNSM